MNALDKCKALIFADYRRRTPGSASLYEKAAKVLPGGVSGNLRYFAPYPLYMASGQGSIVTDIDRNDYIDCFCCNGPLLLGHRHPAVMAAIEAASECGSLLLNPETMVECAQALTRVIPSAERVRFLNSGTEAVMAAVRYARAVTGKDKIVKFYGHYHGQDDQFLVGLGADRKPFGAGIPAAMQESTLTAPFNNIEALEKLLASRDDIACVILDPAMHSGGLWGSKKEFLVAARELTKRLKVILIFDEVISGFRLALGGAQEYFDVTPDMTTLAKALGAGEKLGAVVGSAAIMSIADPLRTADGPRVFQSGTGNDGGAALAAALAAIAEYEKLSRSGDYERLARRVEAFHDELTALFSDHGLAIRANRLGSMMQLFQTEKAVTFETAAGLDASVIELFYLALINHGVLLSLPTSNHIYFSFAHSEHDFERIIAAARRVLRTYPLAEALAEITG